MAKSLRELKQKLEKDMHTLQVAKTAKYRVKNSEGNYDVIHLETSADQVITTAEKQFVSAAEKTAYADKYTKAEMDATIAGVNDTITAHEADAVKHITAEERVSWDSKAEGNHTHEIADLVGIQETIEDTVGAMTLNNEHVDFTYNDEAGKLSARVKKSDTATKLVAPVNINGVAFDGSEDIRINAGTKITISKTAPTDAEGTLDGSMWYEDITEAVETPVGLGQMKLGNSVLGK